MPHRVVLFTKRDCGPCKRAKNFVRTNRVEPLVILEKENHPALVAAFDLNVYPTLVVADGTDLVRKHEGVAEVTANIKQEVFNAFGV